MLDIITSHTSRASQRCTQKFVEYLYCSVVVLPLLFLVFQRQAQEKQVPDASDFISAYQVVRCNNICLDHSVPLHYFLFLLLVPSHVSPSVQAPNRERMSPLMLAHGGLLVTCLWVESPSSSHSCYVGFLFGGHCPPLKLTSGIFHCRFCMNSHRPLANCPPSLKASLSQRPFQV